MRRSKTASADYSPRRPTPALQKTASWKDYAAPFAVLAALACVAVWMAIQRGFETADLASLAHAPLQSGTAVVVNRVFNVRGVRSSASEDRLAVAFRIGDHVVLARTWDSEKWSRTKVGDTVPVTYRVGKSGNYYIEDWQPPTRR